MDDDLLEPEFRKDYDAWRTTPGPATTGALLRRLQPTIDRGISTNARGDNGPTLRGSAKLLTLRALRTYDPARSKLAVHVSNHLQGLRRVARQQRNAVRLPERIALDQSRLMDAQAELTDQLGREPTLHELSDHARMSTRRIAKLRSWRPEMAEGGLLAAEEGSDDGAGSPAVRIDTSAVIARAVYDDLGPIDQKIMEWTLGLNGAQQLPGSQIAARLGVSPGAVSQRRAAIQARMDELSNMGVW